MTAPGPILSPLRGSPWNSVVSTGQAASPALAAPLAADQTSFSQVLAQATRRPSNPDAEAARDAAQRFVASTLVNPILTQLRESSEAAPPFAPSSAEKQFRALLDAELAQRITRAAHFPLVDRLAHDLLTRSRTAAAPTAAATAVENDS